MDVPEGFEDLFDDGSRAFLVLATLRGGERPVVAPVWFASDESGLLFTTDPTAAKARDMRAHPQVAGVVIAEGDHERYVSVRGEAVEVADPASVGIDVDALYRRIVRRYEGREPNAPFDGAVFRLVPQRMTGYDYRDLDV
ncbi:MAG: pyridoxamine 5'-phosphate oxidase family protein [Actinomycetes bacterium]